MIRVGLSKYRWLDLLTMGMEIAFVLGCDSVIIKSFFLKEKIMFNKQNCSRQTKHLNTLQVLTFAID